LLSEFGITKHLQVGGVCVPRFQACDISSFVVLELMARMMRVGEIAQVHCESRFAYGNAGSKECDAVS
jgi:hypothetical protein